MYRRPFFIPLRPIFVSASLCVLFISHLQAQTGLTQGSVAGMVTDAASNAIVGARIALSSPDKAIVRATLTGSAGTFAITGLLSGTYRIDISASGFATYRNDSVVIAVGRDAHIDAELSPAHGKQEVRVQSSAEAMDTSQSSPVTNIDRDRVEELPIPSRNYLSFTLLAPSLGTANPALGLQSPGAAGEGGFSAGGLRPSCNALYIDGVDDNDAYTGLSRT
ncbi:MAG: carboxypeptidase-like regulatory domain-containing protein, partial [Acidobacteriota bacterium]